VDARTDERWPRLIAQHRENQAALASTQMRRRVSQGSRQALWGLATATASLSAWMATRAIREIDLSPSGGLADSVGLAWGAIYGGALLVLLALTDGIVVGLGRSLPAVPRALVFGAAGTLTVCVLGLLVLLQMSANRLTYV
jgi:hypothetical protein